MDRRRFLATSLAVALAAPAAAEAQQAEKVYRVGIFIPRAPAPSDRATISVLVPAALRGGERRLDVIELQDLGAPLSEAAGVLSGLRKPACRTTRQ